MDNWKYTALNHHAALGQLKPWWPDVNEGLMVFVLRVCDTEL